MQTKPIQKHDRNATFVQIVITVLEDMQCISEILIQRRNRTWKSRREMFLYVAARIAQWSLKWLKHATVIRVDTSVILRQLAMISQWWSGKNESRTPWFVVLCGIIISCVKWRISGWKSRSQILVNMINGCDICKFCRYISSILGVVQISGVRSHLSMYW